MSIFNKSEAAMFIGCFGITLAIIFLFYGTIAYAIVHFASKFW